MPMPSAGEFLFHKSIVVNIHCLLSPLFSLKGMFNYCAAYENEVVYIYSLIYKLVPTVMYHIHNQTEFIKKRLTKKRKKTRFRPRRKKVRFNKKKKKKKAFDQEIKKGLLYL